MDKIKTRLTEENIKNHFICNPDWRELFQKYHPTNGKDWTKNYLEKTKAILEKNGYRIVESERLAKLKCVRLALYKGDEWIFEKDWNNETYAMEQLLITAINDNDINFSTLE